MPMPSVPKLNLSIFSSSSSSSGTSRACSTKEPAEQSAPLSPQTASPERVAEPDRNIPVIQLSACEDSPARPIMRVSKSIGCPGEGRCESATPSEKQRAHSIAVLPRRSETAPTRYSRPGNYVDGNELSDERDIYEYFQQFIKQYNPSDVLVYGRTRREAVQQYGHLRHFWLVELWMNVGFRYLLKNSIYASREARALAEQPGANLMHIAGFNTNQNAWIIASDYPRASVHAYRDKNQWPKHVQRPEIFSGPENYSCLENDGYLPFPHADNTFDVVNSRSLAYLIPAKDLDLLLSELYRITKPGGVVEIFSKLRDVTKLHCFGKSAEEFFAYEAEWKAAIKRSPFKSTRRAQIALPQCWGSDIRYVTELVLLYYRIVYMQVCQAASVNYSDEVLEELVKLDKPTKNTTEPVVVDLYILQKL